jgi:hypothetical protein
MKLRNAILTAIYWMAVTCIALACAAFNFDAYRSWLLASAILLLVYGVALVFGFVILICNDWK